MTMSEDKKNHAFYKPFTQMNDEQKKEMFTHMGRFPSATPGYKPPLIVTINKLGFVNISSIETFIHHYSDERKRIISGEGTFNFNFHIENCCDTGDINDACRFLINDIKREKNITESKVLTLLEKVCLGHATIIDNRGK